MTDERDTQREALRERHSARDNRSSLTERENENPRETLRERQSGRGSQIEAFDVRETVRVRHS